MPAFTRTQRFLLAVVPPLAAALIRLLGATWRIRDVQDAGTPVGHTIPGPTVFAFWHESLLSCAYRFRGLGIAILISRSFDGELIARTVERLGFTAVRGSSTRGGVPGLRGMVEAYAAGHICAFTADGPKGPRQVAKPGPVQLARLVSAPWLGCFHAEPVRAWRMGSWDRFAIPKPFTTVQFAWPAHTAPELETMQKAMAAAVTMSSVS
ncbi:MAG: lysophospholipid acyltransferase family protein [Janthinobacterium lividum]